MAQILATDKAQSLLDKGFITQDFFDKNAGIAPAPAPNFIPAAAPDPMATMPPPAPIEQIAEPDPLANQREFLKQKLEKERLATEAAEARLVQEEQDEVLKKRDLAVKMGYSQQEIDANLPPPAPVGQAIAPVEQPQVPAVPVQPMQPAMPAQPDMMQQMDEMFSPLDMQQKIIMSAANSAQAAAKAEEALYNNEAIAAAKRNEDNQKWEDDRRKDFETRMGDLEKKQDDLANRKIDPDNFWATKSTGQKIMGAIALALGAVGAARTGQNPAMAVIQNAIERDIDAQKFNINNEKDNVSRKFGLYREMMDTFKDERLARAAAGVQAMNMAQMKLNGIAARYKGTEMQTKAAMLSSQLDEKKMAYKMQFADQLRQASMRKAIASGMPIDPEMLPEKDRQRSVGSKKAFYGLARSEGAASTATPLIITHETGEDGLKELIEISKKSRIEKLSPQLSARAKVLSQMLQGSLRTILIGPGAVSEGERILLQDIIVNPSTVLSLGTEQTKLEALLDRTKAAFDSTLNAYNLSRPDQRLKNNLGFQPL